MAETEAQQSHSGFIHCCAVVVLVKMLLPRILWLSGSLVHKAFSVVPESRGVILKAFIPGANIEMWRFVCCDIIAPNSIYIIFFIIILKKNH